MSSKSVKFERVLSDAELGPALQALLTLMAAPAPAPDPAQQPAQEPAQEPAQTQGGAQGQAPAAPALLTAADVCKIKFTVKREFGEVQAKLKVEPMRPGCPCDPEAGCVTAANEPEKYSRLKKRMKQSFKAIRSSLEAGRAPAAEAVASFLADSDVMVCYPGHGDEFYLDYSRACRELARAWEAGDLAAMAGAAEALEARKNECHDRYK
ncbi:GAK system XXXCH domain-containing protein [Desulfocurvus vexinensis]|uniref:GAK system XXXCH domain-containing protein n=1 Tax=Desulfocurvus vexinensis TaxID=399548 RepID=UPI0004BA0134|nr:GAK system XXXCH domain-containing protein [Desulfocurvus vexinensis]